MQYRPLLLPLQWPLPRNDVPTDLDLVSLSKAIYDPSYGDWTHYFDGSAADGICAGIKDNCLVFRGSITLEDWYRDLLAFPRQPLDHPQLGRVHAGFYEGMDEFLAKAFQLLGPGTAFCGHSLGAARAWLAAGVYIAQGGRPSRITTCGSPRVGCGEFRQLVTPYLKSSFKNRFDPVTDVPIWLPDFPVVEPADFTMLDEKPLGDDFDPLADHSIQLYLNGARR